MANPLEFNHISYTKEPYSLYPKSYNKNLNLGNIHPSPNIVLHARISEFPSQFSSEFPSEFPCAPAFLVETLAPALIFSPTSFPAFLLLPFFPALSAEALVFVLCVCCLISSFRVLFSAFQECLRVAVSRCLRGGACTRRHVCEL